MPEFELEKGLGAQRKEKEKVGKSDIARDFAAMVAEKETNEKLKGNKDAEAWKRMYWTIFENNFYKKLEELEK